MSKEYNSLDHSVVQGLIRNEPHGRYEASDFHEALLFAIAREIGRVHWNRFQSSWDRWSDDPHIPGIQWRRYTSGCDCPEDNDGFTPRHEDDCPVCQPNFGFGGIEFTWYKNPGRGMSINKDLAPAEWVEWFDRCIAKIKEFDTKNSATQDNLFPFPKKDHFNTSKCHVFFKLGDYPRADEARIPSMKSIEEHAAMGDFNGDGWEMLIPEDPDMRRLFFKGVFWGIGAEKVRATREDRPKQESK